MRLVQGFEVQPGDVVYRWRDDPDVLASDLAIVGDTFGVVTQVVCRGDTASGLGMAGLSILCVDGSTTSRNVYPGVKIVVA